MHHLAIMKKSWKLIPKILSGEKTIESRWYTTRRAPWNKISAGDVIFFKNTGESVTARANVLKVLQFKHYSQKELRTLISKYGGNPGICFVTDSKKVFDWAKNKKYAILIFLKDPKLVRPFNVDKTGFGNACAWITVKDIRQIKS